MHLLRLALRPWRLSLASQLSSVFMVGVLLFFVAILFFIQVGLNPVIDRLNNEDIMTAFLNPVSEENREESGEVVDQISVLAGASARVEVIERDQFLERIRDRYPELAHELFNLGNEIDKLVPRFVQVTGYLPKELKGQIQALPGVESVDSSEHRFRHILGAFVSLQWGARVLLAGVLFALCTGLFHLARINGRLQSDAISLMKLMGADRFRTAIPGIVSGLVAGGLGGILSGSVWVAFCLNYGERIRELSPILVEMQVPNLSFGLLIPVAGAILGAFSGLLSERSNESQA